MTYWIIAGFGFLFSIRAIRPRTEEPATGLSIHGLWRGSLDFLVSALLLVTLYDLAAEWVAASPWFKEASVLGMWIAAYLVGKYQRKPDLYFVSLAVLAFGVVTAHHGWIYQVSFAAVIISGVFLFQVFFQGLKYALRFTRLPNSVKGWPAFCLLAFSIVMALSGVARLIF